MTEDKKPNVQTRAEAVRTAANIMTLILQIAMFLVIIGVIPSPGG